MNREYLVKHGIGIPETGIHVYGSEGAARIEDMFFYDNVLRILTVKDGPPMAGHGTGTLGGFTPLVIGTFEKLPPEADRYFKHTIMP